MKLYTEAEIVSFLKREFSDEINAETFMENLAPIEIPSDDDIWNEADKEETSSKHYAFTRGAKYMLYKIQGGNNAE